MTLAPKTIDTHFENFNSFSYSELPFAFRIPFAIASAFSMFKQRSPMLPNELMDRISEELTGMDLLNFAIAALDYLNISNYQLARLLRGQLTISMDKEIKSLTCMWNSPYVIVEQRIALPLSSHKWNHFVYGPFKIDTTQRSLKYFSTTLFFVYTRLWPFTPFYYDTCYPILDVFQYPCRTITVFYIARRCRIYVNQKDDRLYILMACPYVAR